MTGGSSESTAFKKAQLIQGKWWNKGVFKNQILVSVEARGGSFVCVVYFGWFLIGYFWYKSKYFHLSSNLFLKAVYQDYLNPLPSHVYSAENGEVLFC